MERTRLKIRRHVIVPLCFMLMLLMGVSIASMFYFQKWHVEEDFLARLFRTELVFKTSLQEKAEVLTALINVTEKDPRLRELWLAGDRKALLDYTEPIFAGVLSRHRITHFYFMDRDGVCFLRVHKPDFFGDKIDRFTMEQAMNGDKDSCGVELGPLGTFTLRVVHPWRIKGELVGYIELGKEIDRVVTNVERAMGVETFFLVDKSFLDKDMVMQGADIVGHTLDWGQFADFVIMGGNDDAMPSDLREYLTKYGMRKMSGRGIIMSPGAEGYREGIFPLTDAGGRNLGNVIVMETVTAHEIVSKQVSITLICLYGILAVVLLSLFYIYMGYLEKVLDEANARITKQKELLNAANKDLERKLFLLQEAMSHIKRLEGLVPICANCKKMLLEGHDSKSPESWIALEKYISERTDASFTHGLCPGCVKKMYDDMAKGK